jgi:hypothetical protein
MGRPKKPQWRVEDDGDQSGGRYISCSPLDESDADEAFTVYLPADPDQREAAIRKVLKALRDGVPEPTLSESARKKIAAENAEREFKAAVAELETSRRAVGSAWERYATAADKLIALRGYRQ